MGRAAIEPRVIKGLEQDPIQMLLTKGSAETGQFSLSAKLINSYMYKGLDFKSANVLEWQVINTAKRTETMVQGKIAKKIGVSDSVRKRILATGPQDGPNCWLYACKAVTGRSDYGIKVAGKNKSQISVVRPDKWFKKEVKISATDGNTMEGARDVAKKVFGEDLVPVSKGQGEFFKVFEDVFDAKSINVASSAGKKRVAKFADGSAAIKSGIEKKLAKGCPVMVGLRSFSTNHAMVVTRVLTVHVPGTKPGTVIARKAYEFYNPSGGKMGVFLDEDFWPFSAMSGASCK
jgi:hypothetical protein